MPFSPILGRRLAITAAVLTPLATFAAFPWLLTNIFSSTYLPHGFCFMWNPRLLWLHVVSDLTIWLSYCVIAFTLTHLVHGYRRVIRFHSIFILFGSFIIACGFTHLIDVIVLWKPLYWLQGDMKLGTAVVSLITAVALPYCIPQIKAVLAQAAVSSENERRFLAAAESSLDSFLILQSARNDVGDIVDFRIEFVNTAGARLVNLTPDGMIGRMLCELRPEHRNRGFFEKYKRVVETGQPFQDEIPVGDIEDLNAEWLKMQVVKLDNGVSIGLSDISARKSLEMEKTRVFTESLIFNSPAAVIVTDCDHLVTAMNPAAQKMLWYKPEELVGRATPLVFYDQAEVETRAQRMSIEAGGAITAEQVVFSAGHEPGGEHEDEWTFLRKGGSTLVVQVTVTPLKSEDGQPTGCMITAYDVSERKRREEYISHLAHHDVLTGLPTRQLLMDRLEMMISRSRRFITKSALLMIDLNNFKQINDTHGHHIGDRLLVQIAERLRFAVRAMDTVARMGGDEFVVLVSDLDSPAAAEQVARKLLTAFNAPFNFNDMIQIDVHASIGVCVYPDSGADATSLLRNADIAMYHAKASRRHSYQVFDRKIAELVLHQRELETALTGALDAQELHLHYQPQFSLADGAMVGVEALLRWNSHRFGSVPPAQFVPVCEESGLILPIGAWVIHTACAELRRLQQQFGDRLVMAVNLSARQLDQPDLLQVIEQALADNSLPPGSLEIEITESILMSDSPHATAFFEGLRKLGVRVAIDDFGTGFSSMSYLLRFSVNRLKIDRCFIQDAPTNPNSATVTSAIIALAHQLKVSVVAEGVESEEQMDFLREAGCDDVQGFHLCRPVPPEQIASAMVRVHTLSS